MSFPVYYVEESDTLPVFFDSFAGSTGASITMSGIATSDIEIYKDTSMTQRASDSGYVLLDTDGIDLDGTTGIHGFSIDLSDNTDAGFYAVGSWYHVVIATITIDSQTVNFVACAFRIVSATRGMAGTALPAAAADAAGGLPISDAGGLDLDAKIGALTFTVAGDVDVNVQSWSGSAVAAVDTAGYPVVTIKDGVGQGEISLTAGVIDSVTAVGSVSGAVGSVTGNVGGNVVGSVASVTGNVGGNVTGSVGSVVAGVTIADATSDAVIADAVWNAATATYGIAGSYGLLIETDLDATISSRSSHSAADVWAVGTRTITGGTIDTNNDKTGYALSAAGVDAVWDEPLAAHTTADTPGLVLNMLTQDTVTLSTDVALGSIIGQLLDNGTAWSFDRTTDSLEAIRDRGDAAWITAVGFSTHSAADAAGAVWDEARAGHVGVGSFGEGVASVQGNVTGSVASVTGAVGSVTGNVGGNVVGSVASVTGAVGSVTGNVGGNVVGSVASVTGAVGSVTGNVGGNVTGSVGSLGATAKSDVNAEVVDVVTVDTLTAISQAAPPGTPTLEEALMYLYSALTERVDVNTSGTPDYKFFYTGGGSVAWKKAVTDDGSDYSEAAGITGP